jgi:hypothetical protein
MSYKIVGFRHCWKFQNNEIKFKFPRMKKDPLNQKWKINIHSSKESDPLYNKILN